MRNIYLKAIAIALGACLTTGTVSAAESWTSADTEVQEIPSLNAIRITAKGTNVRVQNAAGQTLEIYNITGVRIAAYKIDSNDTTVSLSCGKGCYILKLGKIARKVSIL